MTNKVQELLEIQQESDSDADYSDEANDSRRSRRRGTPKQKVRNPQLKKRLIAYVKTLIDFQVCLHIYL